MKSTVIPVLLLAATLSQGLAQVPRTISYQGRVQVAGTNFTGTGLFKFALVSKGTNLNRQATAVATVTSGFVTSVSVTDGGFGYSAPPAVTISGATGSGAMATAQVSGGVVTTITVHNAGSGYTAPTVMIAPPTANAVFGTYWSNDGTSTGGGQPSTAVTVAVQGGLFTVILGEAILANMTPIPPEIFANNDVHLRIWFNDGAQGFSQLTPDQALASVGYAMAANILPQSIGTANLANGAVTTSQLGDAAVTGAKIAAGTITIDNIFTQTDFGSPSGQIVLTNPVFPTGDFGRFVTAISGQLLVGGTDASSNGVIFVFQDNGAFVRTITTPSIPPDNFGFAVARVGANRLLVGAPTHTSGPFTNVGIAYLFDIPGGTVITITNPVPEVGGSFGLGLAPLGVDKLVITAAASASGVPTVGRGYVFNLAGNLLATLTNPIPATDDLFGLTAAGLGDGRIAIGAPLAHAGATNSGMTVLYNSDFSLFKILTNPVPNESGIFGVPLTSTTGNRLLVGAARSDLVGTNEGAIYVFNSQGTLLSTITNPLPQIEQFGVPITIVDDTRLLVGSLFSPSDLFLMEFNGNLISRIPGPSSGYYGSGFFDTLVALPGDRIVVPDYYATNVSIYSFGAYVPGLVADRLRAGSVDTAGLQDGAVTSSKLASGAVLGALLEEDGANSGLDADLFDGLESSAFWQTAGNANVFPGQFLGTTELWPLEFRVNNLRALRLEPHVNETVNVIAGSHHNSVFNSAIGVTIAGGGGFFGIGSGTNSVSANFGTIGGGRSNTIARLSDVATIDGGFANTISTNADFSSIGGGTLNTIAADSRDSTIAGGAQNDIGTSSAQSTVSGGVNNNIGPMSFFSVIAGGAQNDIGSNSVASVIGGGSGNDVLNNSTSAMIPGGSDNAATNRAFAAGTRAKALHSGAFVWGDASTFTDLPSTNDNSVTMRASGGYRLFSSSAANVGVFLAPGGGGWAIMSDRNAKENFQPVDPQSVLDKVTALPMTTWNYKTQPNSVRHIGPMAQDFKAAFGVGETETGITTVDADGVALAAIQGLNQKLEAKLRVKNSEIEELKRAVAELQQFLSDRQP